MCPIVLEDMVRGAVINPGVTSMVIRTLRKWYVDDVLSAIKGTTVGDSQVASSLQLSTKKSQRSGARSRAKQVWCRTERGGVTSRIAERAYRYGRSTY